MNKTVLFLPILLSFCLAIQPSYSQEPEATTESFLNQFVKNADKDELQAVEFVDQGKFDQANDYLVGSLDTAKAANDIGKQIDLLYFLALIDRKNDKIKGALKNLRSIEVLIDKVGRDELKAQMVLSRRIADCYYDDRKLEDAITNYSASLISSNYVKDSTFFKQELLESLAGCYMAKGDYQKSIDYLLKLKEAQEVCLDEHDLASQGNYFWTVLQLSQAYVHIGQKEKAVQLRPILVPMLETFIKLRMRLEEENKIASVHEDFMIDYLKKHSPSSVADFLYVAYTSKYRIKSLPLIAWRNNNVPLKAAILCIHGMGLENRAFTIFGKTMAERGFFVCALDVRGFGSWLAAPGSEKILFKDTIGDIKFVLDLLKDKDPQMPVFVLGESMGGAIALRAASELDEQIAGVIASVPSAERFQDKKMALDVAFHFLKNPNKPYAMMDTIQKQATARPELLSSWSEDAKAKEKVSPKELIKFSIFMRTTQRACNKIVKTPAFIVQGLKDTLVKPQGTFKMFERIVCPDKDMFILGTSEHLIFETDLQSDILLDTLTTWLEKHLVPKSDKLDSTAESQLPKPASTQ